MIGKNLILIYFLIAGINSVLTWILLRHLNFYLMQKGIYGIDVNKPDRPKIPEEGGISIVISLLVSFGIYGYYFNYPWIVSIMITTLLISVVGLIDHFRNIQPYPKFIYCAIIGAFYTMHYFQKNTTLFGELTIINGIITVIVIGALYSILVNSYNVLAGFNGLESGVTAISSATLAVFFYKNGHVNEAMICGLVFISYSIFWSMNKYPAKIFIGDTGTLVPASIYLGLAVYSDHLYPVILVLTPHLINIIIKYMSAGVSSRTDHSPLEYKDGLLYLPKNNYLSLIRLYLLSGPKDEKRIVYYVYAIESVFCILALLINYIY